MLHLGPTFRAAWRNTPRFVLVVLQVALTLAIVANCLTLILDARAELGRPSGFVDDQLVSVRIANWDPSLTEDQEAALAVHRQDLAALRAMPGVVAASSTSFVPWIGGGSSNELMLAGVEMERLRTQFYFVDDGALETLGIDLVEGRWFTPQEIEADYDSGAFPVVATRAFAELLAPAADGRLLGKALTGSPEDTDRYTVVGIIDPFFNPYGWPIGDYAVFLPGYRASGSSSAMLVHAEPGRTAEVAAAIERAIPEWRAGRAVQVQTIAEIKHAYHAPNRLVVTALDGVMGALLLVTALGILGVASLAVAERRRQIGTRRALGATRGDVLRQVLLENALVTGCGVALGIALAWGLDLALAQAIDGARMPWTAPLVGAGLLLAIALLAALGPALRAARIAPAIATRAV